MIADYLPILFVFILAAGFAGAAVIATHFVGPNIKDATKLSPYESGLDPAMKSHPRLNVRYFIVALIFIIFDIEIIFLYPWAVVFKDFLTRSPYIFYEMLFFLGVLLIGYIYIWRKGVFEWE